MIFSAYLFSLTTANNTIKKLETSKNFEEEARNAAEEFRGNVEALIKQNQRLEALKLIENELINGSQINNSYLDDILKSCIKRHKLTPEEVWPLLIHENVDLNNFQLSLKTLVDEGLSQKVFDLIKDRADLANFDALVLQHCAYIGLEDKVFDLIKDRADLSKFTYSLENCVVKGLSQQVFDLIKEQRKDLVNFKHVLEACVYRELEKEVLDLIKGQSKSFLDKRFSETILGCIAVADRKLEGQLLLESLHLLEQIPFHSYINEELLKKLLVSIEKQANPKDFPNLLSACANYSSIQEKILNIFKVGQFQGEINEQKVNIKSEQEVYISGTKKGIIKSYLQGFFEVQTSDEKVYKIVAENLIKYNPDILPIGLPVKIFNKDVLYAGFYKNDNGEIISFKFIDEKKNIFEIPSKIFLKENKLLLRDENFVLNNLHLIPNNINIRYGTGQEGLITGLTEDQKYFLVQNNKTNQNDKVLAEEIIRMNLVVFRGIPAAKINKIGQTKLTYELKPENWIKATKYKVNEIEVILPINGSVNHQRILNKLSLWLAMGLPEHWIKAVKTIEIYPFANVGTAANSSGDIIRFFDGENNFDWGVFNHEITHSLVMKENKNINPNISHETWTKIANNTKDRQFVRINGEKYAIEKETINSDFLEKACKRYTTKIEELETKTKRTEEESLKLADDKLNLARVNALRKAQANGINIESIIYLYLVDSAGYTKLLLYHHPEEEVNKTIQELVEKVSSVTQGTLKHISILNELAVPVEEYFLAQSKDNNAVTDYGESRALGIEDIPEFVAEAFERYLIQGFPAPKSALQNLKIKQERLKEVEELLNSDRFYSLNDLNKMKESGKLDELLKMFPPIQETIDTVEAGTKLQEEQEELENSIKQIKSRIDRKRHLDYGEDSPVYDGFHGLKEAINSWSDIGEIYLNRTKAFIKNYILGGAFGA